MTSVQTCLHLDQPRHKFIIINIDFPDDGKIQILKDKPYLTRFLQDMNRRKNTKIRVIVLTLILKPV